MNGDEILPPVDLNGLAKLREPFRPEQIGKLPKPTSRDAKKGKCPECDGYHGLPAVHLDYVGHADLTERFLNVDPVWSWEPMARDESGMPVFDKDGGLWIWLTLCGVTRPAYGSTDGKTGGDGVKEAIGDALRNGGMRFGCALDLWRKQAPAVVYAKSGEQKTEQKPRASADLKRDELRRFVAREGWDANRVAELFSQRMSEWGEPVSLREASAEQIESFMVALASGLVKF